MPLPRRRFLQLAAGAAALAAVPRPANAQTYPTRPVRIIVGFGPGSSGDVAARMLAQPLGRLLGQQFIVENRTGAGSNIATNFVAHAPSDGYTLLQGTVANTINAVITPNLGFDFAKDFAPISLFATQPNILVVHPSLGVRSVDEFIKLAREKPGQLSFGSAGVGGASHFTGELFNVMAGTKLVHVPYPGTAQAATDLLGGRVQVMFSPASTVLQFVAEGKLIALASSALQRARGTGAADHFGSGADGIRYLGLVRVARDGRHRSRHHRARRSSLQRSSEISRRRDHHGTAGLRHGRRQPRGICRLHPRGAGQMGARRQRGRTEAITAGPSRAAVITPSRLPPRTGIRPAECSILVRS
jgi:tripartite-type tricarboxylate transporter receptor subunit TctC